MSKDIALGVFFTQTSLFISRETESFNYPFRNVLNDFTHYDIMIMVEEACIRCNKIHFSLDKVYVPLIESSFTCKELKIVMSNPYFLDKTQFWMNRQKIDKQAIINIYDNHTHDEVIESKLSFSDLYF